MINIDYELKVEDFADDLDNFFKICGQKIDLVTDSYVPADGSPVFTVKGKYTSCGWTEWTQGFMFGMNILQYDATGEKKYLDYGKKQVLKLMAPHVTNFGVHDHGFNNISTYGNLLRLAVEGKIPENEWERNFYELALKCSSAVQARRWSEIKDNGGYIYSFNGPHSLFADTIRSLRVLAVGHLLGHVFLGENDKPVSLLERLIKHATATAQYSVYYGEGRDSFDIRGRVAHESIFNMNDGNYRCPNSQQGYSPFTTWTRGLAWVLCAYPEQLECLETISDEDLDQYGGRAKIESMMLKAAQATADFYIEQTPTDGITYWDTGAPNLLKMNDYLDKPADPYNDYEPVDSSASAISAQGLMRLGIYLKAKGLNDKGNEYFQAGLTVMRTLLKEPYISTDPQHQGIILHSIYHQPNGWDHIPEGSRVPNGESSMWGDYHAMEAAVYIQRLLKKEPYLAFFKVR